MKQFFTRVLLMAICSVSAYTVFGQVNYWAAVAENNIAIKPGEREIFPKRFKTFALDTAGIKSLLATAPKEFTAQAKTSPVILVVPMPDGNVAQFKIVETSMLEPALARQFPNFKTYNGQGIDDPTAIIKIDWNDLGFHGMIMSASGGSIFIDPIAKNDKTNYIIYNKADVLPKGPFIENGKPADFGQPGKKNYAGRAEAAGACVGGTLRTYRLAVACTGEYARAVGGANVTVGQALSAIITSVNRVNGVYESEVDIRMVLISNNSKIVFTNPNTDPFDGNDDASILIDESQQVITDSIGSANFDIGHTFSTGGGGLAGLGVVCYDPQKASGITGSTSPVGDPYDIDFVAHEMGHQFGADHTFNATVGSCADNGSQSSNVEPGSGITIMGYAGICGSTNNLANNSIPYFHGISFDQITDYIQNGDGNSCAVKTSTGNVPPTVNAGNDYTIPKSTPFVLNGTATDADGDPIIYSWEQMNYGGTFWNLECTSR